MYKKINFYQHQNNLRSSIKVKVHKEYYDEIFFLQFLSHLLIHHHIFCEQLPFSIIFKFCKRDISLKPLRDPREQHPGEARQRI